MLIIPIIKIVICWRTHIAVMGLVCCNYPQVLFLGYPDYMDIFALNVSAY